MWRVATRASLETVLKKNDEIDRLRQGLCDVRAFLTKPEWGTWLYMEGSDVYDDKDRALFDIAYALGEIT